MTQQNITTAQVIEYLKACHQEGRTIYFFSPSPFVMTEGFFQNVQVQYPEFEPLEHETNDDGEPMFLNPMAGFRFTSEKRVRFKGFENVDENIALLSESTFDLYWHRLNYKTVYPDVITPITRDTVRDVYAERLKEENERHEKAINAINQWCWNTLPKFAK